MTAVEVEVANLETSDPDLPDPETGLSLADEASIMLLQAQVMMVCLKGARRVLSAQEPAVAARLEAAVGELKEAEAALVPAHEKAAALQAELAEVQAMAAAAGLAGDDAPLADRLKARAEKTALADEAEALEQRIAIVHRISDPAELRKITADREVKSARADLKDLGEAIAFPFDHPRGMATAAHEAYLLKTGLWYEVGGPDARDILRKALRSTGLGAEVERNAIAAFTAGVREAVQAGGNTKRWRDGTAMHVPPGGGAPVVTIGEATYADLAIARAVPVEPGPPGAEVMAGLRNAAGWSPQ
jgi:hypothetical protein